MNRKKIMIEGKNLVTRIMKELEARNESRAKLCESVGIDKKSLSNWCGKHTSLPSLQTALNIADYLRVPLRWLITGEREENYNLTPQERNLIAKYTSLTEQDKFEINALIEAKLAVHQEGKKKDNCESEKKMAG